MTIVLAVILLVILGCMPVFPTKANLKGNRMVGIAVTSAQDDNFDYAFAKALTTGMQATNLALSWDDLETTTEQYNPTPNFLAIADSFYPSQNIRVALEVNPIDTTSLRIPKDLQNKPIDHPVVIERYKKLLDWILTQVPNLELTSLTIGNEIDSYLGNDTTKWRQYRTFFKAVSAYARSKQPELKIGTKATFDGLTGQTQTLLEEINLSSDIIMATYYPLKVDFKVKPAEVVNSDFEKLTSIYTERPIFLLEVGYPSGTSCGSSEQRQSDFIKNTFEAWDKHQNQIGLISFTWLTDLPLSMVNEMTSYYGISHPCFVEFLATLGLRTRSDIDKRAFTQLKQEVGKRSW